MIEQNTARLNAYFDECVSLCGQRGRMLRADDRTDEAVFENVRANVYEIFRTVLSVAVKRGGGDPEAVRRFFIQKTEQIPADWTAAYEQAERHNNVEKMQIERIKLDTAGEIRETFAKIWEKKE